MIRMAKPSVSALVWKMLEGCDNSIYPVVKEASGSEVILRKIFDSLSYIELSASQLRMVNRVLQCLRLTL